MHPAQTLLLSLLTVLPLLGCDPVDGTADAAADEDATARDGLLLTIETRPCGHVTRTQSQWGAVCNGDNAGCDRDEQFMSAFPEGLIVGCGVLTANLVTPKSIEYALPSGGMPRALLPIEAVAFDGTYDPKVSTALFGQVVALGLNIGFDTMAGKTATALEDLVVNNPLSPCFGMSVGEVYDQANLALGDCPAQLSAAELYSCVQALNKSFTGQCSDVLSLPE